MTWTNKNNEFIYTIRTLTERHQIEQVTKKNFNQNAYLGKVDRKNKFWLLQGGKVYRKHKLGISLLYLLRSWCKSGR